MTTPSDWIAAARPKTLPAAVAPVIVGAAEATRQGQFDWWPVFICLSFALLVQIATNMANDYFDYIRGADTIDRLGPERLVASGRILSACNATHGYRLCFCWPSLLACRWSPIEGAKCWS